MIIDPRSTTYIQSLKEGLNEYKTTSRSYYHMSTGGLMAKSPHTITKDDSNNLQVGTLPSRKTFTSPKTSLQRESIDKPIIETKRRVNENVLEPNEIDKIDWNKIEELIREQVDKKSLEKEEQLTSCIEAIKADNERLNKEYQKKDVECEKKLRVAEERLDGKIKELLNHIQNQDKKMLELNKEKNELDKKFNAIENNLKKYTDDKIKKMNKVIQKQEKRIEELDKKSSELEAKLNYNKKGLRKYIDEKTEKLNKTIQEHKEKLLESINNIEKKLTKRMQSEIKELKKITEEQIYKVKVELEAKIEAQNMEIHNLNIKYTELEKKIELTIVDLKAYVDERIKELEERINKQLAELTRSIQKEIEMKTKEQEKTIEAKMNEAMKSAKEKYDSDIGKNIQSKLIEYKVILNRHEEELKKESQAASRIEILRMEIESVREYSNCLGQLIESLRSQADKNHSNIVYNDLQIKELNVRHLDKTKQLQERIHSLEDSKLLHLLSAKKSPSSILGQEGKEPILMRTTRSASKSSGSS